MVVEANKVNDCGIYCDDCPNKNLIVDSVSMYADNKQDSVAISIHCEHEDFCKFLIDRIHITDSMAGIFGGDRRE